MSAEIDAVVTAAGGGSSRGTGGPDVSPGRFWQATGRRVVVELGAQPVSVVIAAVLVALAIVSGSWQNGPADALRDVVGAGVGGQTTPGAWALTLASILFCGSLPELIATVLAVLVLVGGAERLMGHRRALAAYLVTGVIATVVGVAAQAIGIAVGESWALQVAYDTTLHPFTPALGAVLAASAFAGPLWRRRIRVFGFAGIVTFLLYDGHPAGLYALVGALAGLALGRVLRPEPRPVDRGWTRSSHHEARVLLSVVVTVTALGPVVTLLTRAPIGILAPVGELFRDVLPSHRLPALCRAALHQAELHGAALQRAGGDLGPAAPNGTCMRDVALGGLHGPSTVLLSILPLVILVVAGAFIRRGRRVAGWAAICVNLLLAGLAALFEGVLPFTSDTFQDMPGHRVERLFLSGLSVAVPLAVAVVVYVNLRHLTVRASEAIVRRYIAGLVTAFVSLSAFYFVVAMLQRGRFSARVSVPDVLLSVPERFVPVGFIGVERLGAVPADVPLRVAYLGVGPVFWLVAVIGLALAASDTSRARAAARRGALDRILRRGVDGHLSHMATWEGNSYWFTADGLAAVAYRVVGSRAITTADPLCRRERAAEVISDFAEWCDDRGLSPVFYSIDADLEPVFAGLGWSTLPVAEETVIRPATFAMTGKKWQDVRSSINRAAKAGVRAQWTHYADLRPGIARQIDEISEQWVAEKNLPELGFTLGGVDEIRSRDVRLMLALDERDRVQAVTSWLPTYRDGVVIGGTLDFMRRRPDSMTGVMEFVIAEAALQAQEDGLEFLSLSAAPLATAKPLDDESSQTERLLGFIARTLEPAYGFATLLAFKKKFQPEFVPLLMAYPDPLELPAIGTALARAYLPELSIRQVPRLLRSVV
ncbi:hypothetical protein AX769_14150 [Frondihabitans sp. PAMC 28766]|uniref:phosphatidylglycerol lysyltransferase domain-containing protein n=1 Tax=Frondihabitans sp. PAMC 28766 TaxID=1795630 RepID=UPI00078B72F8|nr:phosphatidylglycerol lysyltransferase domain-containing protein [Frondihabitans sp. PAMC 28766]AMM21068.1 hypothetical protein AX769_14150 [Frondihabitans sp. PAMC 28766]